MENTIFIISLVLTTLYAGVSTAYFIKYKTLFKQQLDNNNKLDTELLDTKNNHLNKTQELQEKLNQSQMQVTKLQTQLDEQIKQSGAKEQWLTQSSAHLTEQFKLLANQVLSDNQQKFKQQSQSTIVDTLSPLKEEIQKLHQQAVQMSNNDQQERSSLRTMLDIYRKEFADSCASLNKEAVNLTRALKGDNKTQGDWGELVLERILENVGLTKGQEYDVQQTFTDDTGRRLRPDVIVHLPDNKDIIIDSKVSLVAYSKASQCNDAEKAQYLAQHLLSLKKHIKELAEKNYAKLEAINTVETVIMFIPIEAAYVEAIKHDNTLFEYAFERNIVLAYPTNLWTSLKTIQYLWRNDKQNKNAQEIARQAGKMYDKFVKVISHMDQLRKQLNTAQNTFSETYKSFATGRDNLVRKAEKLKKLGANTEKHMPDKLVEFSIEQTRSELSDQDAPIAQLDRASLS